MSYFKKILSRNLFLMLVGDAIIIISALYLSILVRFEFKIPIHFSYLLSNQNLFIILIIKIFCFRLFSLYRGMWRYTSLWDMFNIIKANIIATTCLIFVVKYYVGFEKISRSLFLIDLILSTTLISVSRLGIRLFFSHIITFLNSKIIQFQPNSF